MTDDPPPEDRPADTGPPDTQPPEPKAQSLDLSITAEAGEAYASAVEQALRAAWCLLGASGSRLTTLSLAIVDDAAMADLHERYLNIPGTTDVLTFELDHDADGRVTEGEIVICHDEAVRQTSARRTDAGVTAADVVGLEVNPAGHSSPDAGPELILYAVHGLLHLCGYDDTTPHAYQHMHETEDELLTRLGVGPVFALGTDAPAGGEL
ncbi:MAG: rRNA maturation RNase YbeY [Phycisphaerae bacterium]